VDESQGILPRGVHCHKRNSSEACCRYNGYSEKNLTEPEHKKKAEHPRVLGLLLVLMLCTRLNTYIGDTEGKIAILLDARDGLT